MTEKNKETKEQVKKTEKKTTEEKPKEQKTEVKKQSESKPKSKYTKNKKQTKKKEQPFRNLIVIDATNLIAGRLCTWSAKQALLGNKVVIVNSEKAILTGKHALIVEKYRYFRNETGRPQKGPFIFRLPDRFLRRILKRMLPFKRGRGSAAFKRTMCYIGVPKEFENKAKTLKEADVTSRKVVKFTTIGEVCKSLGGKTDRMIQQTVQTSSGDKK